MQRNFELKNWISGLIPGSGNLRTPVSVGLVSVAVIAFQLVIMQLLSVSQWHHFAYMVISMAMLGFGAAGTVLALFRDFFIRHYQFAVPLLYGLCGISMASTVWLTGVFGNFDAFLLFFERRQAGLLLFTYLVYCLPFFFGGLAVTLVFYREVGRIGQLYFANMAGSGAGAVLIVLLFWLLPLQVLTGLLALIPVTGAWITRPQKTTGSEGKSWSRQSLILKAAFTSFALLVPAAAIFFPVRPEPSEYKAIRASLQLPGAQIIHRSTGPYGQLEVVSAEARRYAPALSLQYRREPPVRDVMYNNGEYYGTLLGRYGSDRDDVPDHENAAGSRDGSGSHILDYTTRGLPYAIRDPAVVLVLKAATGNDVSHALSHDIASVTASEPNRQASRLLTEVNPEWNDSLYLHPAVTLVQSSSRIYFATTERNDYDLIVLPVMETFGGTSGVYAMQEQYHLTLEAFRAMWESLGDQGMIVATTWLDYPPRPVLKLAATWRMLLDSKGLDPGRHLVAIRSWGTVTWLLSKSPVSAVERERMRQFSHRQGFDPLFLEGLEESERDRFNQMEDRAFFSHIDTLIYGDIERFFSGYLFDVRPATDERPYFSHFMQWRTLPQLREIYGGGTLPYMELGFILAAVTFVQIAVVSVILILLPLFRIGWKGTRRRRTFLYFAGTGTGFMFFEIVLIQKFVLYLGNPVYAAAAVLATLLISSGAGSLYSSRISIRNHGIMKTGLLIAGLILVYMFLLMPLLEFSLAWPSPVRILFMVLILIPPAFFMGMMFPLGLRALSAGNESHIPWASGIDSCLSVTATALAMLIALGSGFTPVMGAAALSYVITAMSGRSLSSNS